MCLPRENHQNVAAAPTDIPVSPSNRRHCRKATSDGPSMSIVATPLANPRDFRLSKIKYSSKHFQPKHRREGSKFINSTLNQFEKNPKPLELTL